MGKHARRLVKLDLRENSAGNEGAEALAEEFLAVPHCSLRELSLAKNGVGDRGFRALAKAMEQNRSVIRLDLSKNQIGDSGEKAIATMIMKNGVLEELDIRPCAGESLGMKTARKYNRVLNRFNCDKPRSYEFY